MNAKSWIRVYSCAFVAASCFSATTIAQTFEVASVKPSPNGNNGFSGGCHGVDSVYSPSRQAAAPPLGRCVIRDARLSHMVYMAFALSDMSQLKSNPDWAALGTERFNVEAKSDDPKVTEADLYKMLQNLLVERFQMKYHVEEKEVQGFALLVGKNGPKFKESAIDESEPRLSGQLKGDPIIVDAHKISMPDLAEQLAHEAQAPVVDRTGLKGVYNLKLTFSEKDGPTLSTAIGEQLGLRFEGIKVMQKFFVIDSAKRPSAN